MQFSIVSLYVQFLDITEKGVRRLVLTQVISSSYVKAITHPPHLLNHVQTDVLIANDHYVCFYTDINCVQRNAISNPLVTVQISVMELVETLATE